MAKTKYEQVLEQLDIIKQQAEFCLAKKQNDSDAEIFGEVVGALKYGANKLFIMENQPLRAINSAGDNGVCPPGTYDCSEYCSATPC